MSENITPVITKKEMLTLVAHCCKGIKLYVNLSIKQGENNGKK
jgi:hypothetical protein